MTKNTGWWLAGAILVLTIGMLGVWSSRSGVDRPHVILIMLDTLRADHLSAYGYSRETSPNLDALSKEGILFENAISPSPWTPPAVSSILTGLYPSSHRMMPPNGRDLAIGKSVRLHSDLETLPELLKQVGYTTVGISPNPWITPEFNFDQGFDLFQYSARVTADKITDFGIEHLRKLVEGVANRPQAEEEKLFLYLHYLDPHDPYHPPKPFDRLFSGASSDRPFAYSERMAKFIGLYDGEIRFMDTELGRLFTFLRESDLFKDTLIVIVGDHGEQFEERGDHRHGFKLYDEEVHVPMILKPVGSYDKGSRIPVPVSLVDVVPTILDQVGMEGAANLQGISLFNTRALGNRPGVFSEIRRRYDQRSFIDSKQNKILFSVPFQSGNGWEESERLWREGGDLVGIYARSEDPFERSPLKGGERERRLRKEFKDVALFARASKSAVASDDTEMSHETLEQLRSLGYVE